MSEKIKYQRCFFKLYINCNKNQLIVIIIIIAQKSLQLFGFQQFNRFLGLLIRHA